MGSYYLNDFEIKVTIQDGATINAFVTAVGPQGAEGPQGVKGDKGDKGDTGESGVYVGASTPSSEFDVWINPDGEETFIPTALSDLTTDSNNRTVTDAEKAEIAKVALKADKAQEAWITPTLLNGYTSVSGRPFQYRKNNFNTVEFRGSLITPSTPAAKICDIITGYRPPYLTVFTGVSLNSALYFTSVSEAGSFTQSGFQAGQLIYMNNVKMHIEGV